MTKTVTIGDAAYTKVESSNVDAVAHDGENLLVLFKNGGLYKYRGVPRAVYEEMIVAESVGKFLNARVKPNYQFTKMPLEMSNV